MIRGRLGLGSFEVGLGRRGGGGERETERESERERERRGVEKGSEQDERGWGHTQLLYPGEITSDRESEREILLFWGNAGFCHFLLIFSFLNSHQNASAIDWPVGVVIDKKTCIILDKINRSSHASKLSSLRFHCGMIQAYARMKLTYR